MDKINAVASAATTCQRSGDGRLSDRFVESMQSAQLDRKQKGNDVRLVKGVIKLPVRHLKILIHG
jgi:hypothetical protein